MTDSFHVSSEVGLKIVHFRPKSLTEDEWALWGDSVIACIKAMEPEKVLTAKRWLSLLVAYVRFLIELQLEPPVQPHFTVRLIEAYVSTIASNKSAATRRGELTKIGRKNNPRHPWPIKPKSISRTNRNRPYRVDELISLRRAAPEERTESRRRLFQTVLALGLCVGLDGRTIHQVTPERVKRTGDGVFVSGIGNRPEILVEPWAGKWLSYWAARTEPEVAIAGSLSMYDSKLCTLRGDDGTTRLTTSRLRTTFVLHVMGQHLPLHEIMAITGLTSTSSLDFYLKALEQPPALDSVTLPPILGEVN